MLSPENNFKTRSNDSFAELYTNELSQLETFRKNANYSDILNHIKNYSGYLSDCAKTENPIESIDAATNGTRVINMASTSHEVIEKLHTAHMAACVILLEDFSCPLSYLNDQSILAARESYANSPQSAEPQVRVNLLQRLHGIDAVRTIQLLRIFGLITNRSKDMYQLGLGVATGNKDIKYVHTYPKLQIELNAMDQVVHFKSITDKVADIVISDLDERYKDRYQSYEDDTESSISCFISDTYDLLEKLKKNNIRKRNLITMLRIEPAMIPDAVEFLQRLAPIIDSECDFVLSIGSGDNPEEYNKRINVVSSLFSRLQDAGLSPVLFKFHDDGSALTQLQSLKFGSSPTSSYETLYCKLNKEMIERAYG